MKTEDKWQAEREHFAKGGRVQWRWSNGPWKTFEKGESPLWKTDVGDSYRIHPDDKPVEAPAAQESKCPKCGEDWSCHGDESNTCTHSLKPPQQPKCNICGQGPFADLQEWTVHKCSKPPQEKWEPKVGDKVMMGDKIETIEEVASGSTPYRLKGWGGFIAKSLIRPAPSTDKWEPRFKVGDRVAMIYQGEVSTVVGTVMANATNGTRRVFVKWEHLECWEEESILAPAPWSLPTPPAGQQWHRTDGWKAEWLPSGWRPLLEGEIRESVDEYNDGMCDNVIWVKVGAAAGNRLINLGGDQQTWVHHRTRRPAPTQPATAKTGADFENWWFNANTKTPITEHSMAHARDGWNAAIAFASSAEKENLLAPDESNVRYWTQRIMDLTEDSRTLLEQSISNVIRELLTKDTHYAAAETQMPSVNDLCRLYQDAHPDYVTAYPEAIEAVREACMAHFKGLIYQARLANDRCANAMFDKEQAINRQAEQTSRAEAAEQKVKQLEGELDDAKRVSMKQVWEKQKTADALRREVETTKLKSEERKVKLVKIFDILLGDEPTEESVSLLKKGDGDA